MPEPMREITNIEPLWISVVSDPPPGCEFRVEPVRPELELHDDDRWGILSGAVVHLMMTLGFSPARLRRDTGAAGIQTCVMASYGQAGVGRTMAISVTTCTSLAGRMSNMLSDEDREVNKALRLWGLRQQREAVIEAAKTECKCESLDGGLPAECWCENRKV
jgi:hypothetical protein